MLIKINSNNNLTKTDEFNAPIISMLEKKLERFSYHITRLEVYFMDEDGNNKEKPNDKRCLIEARFEKSQPLAATNFGDTYEKAAIGAIDKLRSILTTKLERIRSH